MRELQQCTEPALVESQRHMGITEMPASYSGTAGRMEGCVNRARNSSFKVGVLLSRLIARPDRPFLDGLMQDVRMGTLPTS